MTARYRDIGSLRVEFESKKDAILARLEEFRELGRRADEDLFQELCFCFLAIQTKARAADAAVRGLADGGLLWGGDRATIARYLRHRVRFHNHKAAFIVQARERFFPPGGPTLRFDLNRDSAPHQTRSWLTREVDGLGPKEASHFLRNIGRGENLAILDRHVLRNLVRHRVIGRVPRSLTSRRYLDIEVRVARFADFLGISVAALDLVFWSRETGEIFK